MKNYDILHDIAEKGRKEKERKEAVETDTRIPVGTIYWTQSFLGKTYTTVRKKKEEKTNRHLKCREFTPEQGTEGRRKNIKDSWSLIFFMKRDRTFVIFLILILVLINKCVYKNN